MSDPGSSTLVAHPTANGAANVTAVPCESSSLADGSTPTAPSFPWDLDCLPPIPAGSTLSSLARQCAADELGETDETRGPALAALRDLVVKDAQLHCRTDDAFLIKFLRHRKFAVESAHQRIRAYLKVRNLLPEVFQHFSPEGVRPLLQSGVIAVLPRRDSAGRLLVVYRVGRWDCDRFSSTDLLRANGVVMEAVLEEEETQVNGVSVLLDLTDLSLRQVRSLNVKYMKRIREVVNKALPVRVKQIHILRGGRLFDFGFRLFSFLLSPKMRQRLVNHGSSVSSLHSAVDPDLLPPESPFCGRLDRQQQQQQQHPDSLDLLNGRWERWFQANNEQRIEC